MPRAIGSAELSILRDYVNVGAAGRELYCQTLEDWGYRYGRLAGDVGHVDKMGSQDVLNVIQAGICDGDRLGMRFDVR